MTYTARLKVFCDNKDILSKLSYTFANTTTKQNYGGKIDSNGCTKVYNCNKLDLIFVELFLNNSKLARVHVPALENGEFNKSTFTLKSTTGTTQKSESNKVPVKVKNELEVALDNLNGTAVYFGNNFLISESFPLLFVAINKDFMFFKFLNLFFKTRLLMLYYFFYCNL